MKKIFLLIIFIPILSFSEDYVYTSYKITKQLNVKSEIKILPNKMISINIINVYNENYFILKQISKTEYIISKGIDDYYINLNSEKAIFINISNNYKITFKNEFVLNEQELNT